MTYTVHREGDRWSIVVGRLRTGHHVTARWRWLAHRRAAPVVQRLLDDEAFLIPTAKDHD